jgi:hypothetical protein
VSPLKYELGFYISKDDILYSHLRENLKPYISLTDWTVQRRRNISALRQELGFYIPEDDTLHSHRREKVRSYKISLWFCKNLYFSPEFYI